MNTRRLAVAPVRLAPVVAVAAALSLWGCAGGSPTAPQPVGNVPADTTPVQPTGQQPVTPPVTGDGKILLLDVQPGKAASFTTQPGNALTIVASAATYSPTTPSFRLSVGDGGTAVASRYKTQSARTGDDLSMPFRAGFSASTSQLLADTPAPAPGMRRLAAAGEARVVGSTDKFWVNTGDSRSTGDLQQTAVLKHVSDHAYFYVDQQAKPLTEGQLAQLVSEFESKIYPRVTGAFGTEAKPGVDGEDRLFIVISPAVDNFGKEKGLMGYFWSRDAIPGTSTTSHSNQKEVLFMTDKLFDYPSLTSFGTLAHEFQHLINFSQKAVKSGYTVAEETWLDEGLSMYAMEVAGYGLPAGDKHIAKDLREFQLDPAAYSLTDWSGNPHGFAYGQSYLFVRYMVDRFGPNVVQEILQSTKAGQQAVEEVLARRQDSFVGTFRAWTIANLISDQPVSANTIYRYKDLPLHGTYEDIVLPGFQAQAATSADVTANLRPWGSAYYTFSAPVQKTWRFDLGDNGSTRLMGAAIVP